MIEVRIGINITTRDSRGWLEVLIDDLLEAFGLTPEVEEAIRSQMDLLVAADVDHVFEAAMKRLGVEP